MDKNIMALLGGASALALMGAGTASAHVSETAPPARSYAELLDPIPNAAERLRAEDQRPASVELAQLYIETPAYHHHHHHHHHHYRYYYNYLPYPYHHRHHHHHHHHYLVVPGPY